MAQQTFPIRIGRKSAPYLRLWGVRPGRSEAVIDDSAVTVRFGWFTFRVPLDNVVRWRIEGPWRWITAIGIRMSVRHRDLSFAGSPHGGVRLDFRTPVRWSVLRVPAIYIAADDNDALAAELARRGIPGEDARTRRG